jgi:aminoglycoside/choline kinase family phosphotransferase
MGQVRDFLIQALASNRADPWRASYLQGDASARAYARIWLDGGSKVLMNAPRMPDGPPVRNGLPYSRIAHLAEDVIPFIAIGVELAKRGLAAPAIYIQDMEQGLLLLEDLGDVTFGKALDAGHSQAELWRAAVDALLALRRSGAPTPMPVASKGSYTLPVYDRGALAIETELLLDWYWPAHKGGSVPSDARRDFESLWSQQFDRLLDMPRAWVLRDFHSPNLMWRPERTGLARVGILDFQDAVQGPWAFDLVSLLQDARLDVPAALEKELFDYYCERVRTFDASFNAADFAYAYAALGAQRNTKIIGIFARLARRDAKPVYLQHIPRIWRYLERDLAHPSLSDLRGWYDRHFPPCDRTAVLAA